MNRRELLKLMGCGVALPLTSLPCEPDLVLKPTLQKEPIAYVVISDGYPDKDYKITRTWSVFWNPEGKKAYENYYRRFRFNIRDEIIYEMDKFPNPVQKVVDMKNYPPSPPLRSYKQFHCFRTYKIDFLGNPIEIYDENGNLW
jgi:hypothetical protein